MLNFFFSSMKSLIPPSLFPPLFEQLHSLINTIEGFTASERSDGLIESQALTCFKPDLGGRHYRCRNQNTHGT
ncbi:hypothetical protein PRUPE_1G386200 [Prunus persica]|uniref:Uncharacterized protein n=1 Tax=Prunus persica TaxID=3760 RepID=A0A251RCI4_PRUPE|nr:hypothetical protein PRUPE_1G386200 [Prunus persica]